MCLQGVSDIPGAAVGETVGAGLTVSDEARRAF